MVYQLERAHTDSRCREKSQTGPTRLDSHARHHGKNKLATRLLPGVTHPSVGPGQLLLVETEIYGLVSGPIWLRASLTVDLSAAGYVKSRTRMTSVCSNGDTSEGQVLIDVDDFIEGGKEPHRKAMDSFYEQVPLWQIH